MVASGWCGRAERAGQWAPPRAARGRAAQVAGAPLPSVAPSCGLVAGPVVAPSAAPRVVALGCCTGAHSCVAACGRAPGCRSGRASAGAKSVAFKLEKTNFSDRTFIENI